MVPAEPPTPRRPAASSPVRHTQRPGVGRPPPTPPPAESAAEEAAARSICPLAGPGRAGPGRRYCKRQAYSRPDGAQCGEGKREGESGLRGGGRHAEARPGPAPSLCVTAPRRVGRMARARAL